MKPSRRARPREIADRIDDSLLGYEAATPHLLAPPAPAGIGRSGRARLGRVGFARTLLTAFAAAVSALALPG